MSVLSPLLKSRTTSALCHASGILPSLRHLLRSTGSVSSTVLPLIFRISQVTASSLEGLFLKAGNGILKRSVDRMWQKKRTMAGPCHILQVFLLIIPFPHFKNTLPGLFLLFICLSTVRISCSVISGMSSDPTLQIVFDAAAVLEALGLVAVEVYRRV